ncbi:hypothetical protein AALO_G00027490 [Alosa alosa]|uniref:Schwannomin interacting protein 1 C-terminal domain-containing protein n=1 Tax=Alosa alosa TaxID=278164 RepID=A0AAV6HEP7_9TELE|nr:hypothetical protein AALO_G00027490 [Alosa alosa]
MEGDTEKTEVKASDDIKLSGHEVTAGGSAAVQDVGSVDDQSLPIMHWEALSLRIAELEKQEEERRERAKTLNIPERGRVFGSWKEDRQHAFPTGQWVDSDEDDCGGCRSPVTKSRFNSQKNLQLCFINNSESDEDEKSGSECSKESEARGGQSPGLKLEVQAALRALRDQLLAEQKEKERLTCSDSGMRRKLLDRSDLQTCSVQQLDSLRESLFQNIHDLSSQLVAQLLVRDHLRTKQDAMLLDVQDMTSL